MSKNSIALAVMLAALVVSGAVLYAACGQQGKSLVLEIRNADTGKLCGKWPLETGGEFAVEFIHSVHRSPVRETYRVEDAMLRPYKVRFSSFGAGMASSLDEGQVLGRDGDALYISGFKLLLKEIRLIPGSISNHILYINGEKISLIELCGKNNPIVMRIAHAN